jgi:uncharacterized protein (TIGR02231 family)
MGQSPQMATTPVETEIIAVAVYPTQARITRRGTVHLGAGETTLELTDLPVTLQPQTVQAQGYSSSPVTLQTVQVTPIPALAAQEIALQAAANTVRDLEDQFRQAKDHLMALGLKRTFLETLAERSSRTFPLGLAQQQVDLAGVTDLLAYVEAQYKTVAAAIAQQERHKHDLDQQLQDARQQHHLLENALPKIHYRICLPLHMGAADTVDIEVTYQVDQVQWHPCYDIRFGDQPDRLTLDYLANISQQTGEDWPDVPVTLSTAIPNKTPMVPQLEAWYVDLPRQLPTTPATKQSKRSRSPSMNEVYHMLGAVPGSELPPGGTVSEPQSQAGAPAMAVVRFKALETATIPSDGESHRVCLAQNDFASQFTYVALPQQYDAAYLQAHLTNPANGLPLLAGTAHLFREGGYIGQERFDYVAPGQSFQLSLGLDERFSVQREPVQQEPVQQEPAQRKPAQQPEEAKSKGLQCQVSSAYRLSFHNPLAHAVQMTVLEQVPVSRSEPVKVHLDPSTPPATVSKEGICQWNLTLPPHQVTHIQYNYQVEYPCGVTVTGLTVDGWTGG